MGQPPAEQPVEATPEFFGRAAELQRLHELIAARQNVLVLGPIGIGKTALVTAATKECPRVVWVNSVAPVKAALQTIVAALVQHGAVSVEDATALSRLPVPTLSTTLCTRLIGYIVVLDRLELVTPAMAPVLEALLAWPMTIGVATELPASVKLTRAWWRFPHKLTVPPLTPHDAQQLFWRHAGPNVAAHAAAWEQAVVATGGGNPLAITTLAAQASVSPDRPSVDHPAGRRELDLTPGLLCLGAGIIAVRFIALGLNDVDTYILAGIGGAFFLVARYFIYRLLRRRV